MQNPRRQASGGGGMTERPDRLHRFDLIIDLRLSMREWGDTPEYVRSYQAAFETNPIDDLERASARWRTVIEARRKRQPSEAKV